jgi:hypothetical protein
MDCPIGCAAAPQHAHVPGRAWAHVGIRSRQDLIPSELATNLVEPRVFSTVDAEHDGEGKPGQRIGPPRHLNSALARAFTRAGDR